MGRSRCDLEDHWPVGLSETYLLSRCLIDREMDVLTGHRFESLSANQLSRGCVGTMKQSFRRFARLPREAFLR